MNELMDCAISRESSDDEYKPPKLRWHHITSHQLVTRKANGVVKPIPKYILSSSISEVKPSTSIRSALQDPIRKMAMQTEFNALVKNGTWKLTLVRCFWQCTQIANGYIKSKKNMMVWLERLKQDSWLMRITKLKDGNIMRHPLLLLYLLSSD